MSRVPETRKCCRRFILPLIFCLTLPSGLFAQTITTPANPKATLSATELYRQLNKNGLDPDRVYSIRDAWMDREDIHLRFHDGTIAFTKTVDGRVTGALFDGEGEVLLAPPDRVERWSLGAFTGSAILEEKFTNAYLRFNDETVAELMPFLRRTGPAEAQEFTAKWDLPVQSLSGVAALRLLVTMVDSQKPRPDGGHDFVRDPKDRLLYVRMSGERYGIFDLNFDTKAREQISVGQLAPTDGISYYDIWTSFPMRSLRASAISGARSESSIATQTAAEAAKPEAFRIPKYFLQTTIKPPHEVQVQALVNLAVNEGSHRAIRFELSRFLQVREVTSDGQPVEFIQNEALQGTDLARRGNDLLTVVFPKALEAGTRLQLRFVYGGDVLSEAGSGLMYIGARGIWYPNFGVAMSDFDLEFRYPGSWTLLATGKRAPVPIEDAQQKYPGEQIARWVSERPIPFAGFNLGQYGRASAKAGSVLVETYAAEGMEKTFPPGRPTAVVIPGIPRRSGQPPIAVLPPPPNPVANAEFLAEDAARAITFLSQRLGPYPYTTLALTQMPGRISQGWPGLIFLSSFAFLSPDQRAQARMDPFENIFYGNLMLPHETAHQWWGDLLLWKSYREQWLVEGLSNYCALLMLEQRSPAEFRTVMERYRQDLLAKNKKGIEVTDAGPVTLGVRLISSRFPDGYEVISYGRGTWLFHMLRGMLLEPGIPQSARANRSNPGKEISSADNPFFRALRKLRQRFEGKEITTRDVQQAFEEELPASLRFENRKSLDWFFDGWVNGTAVPHLQLSDVKFSTKGTASVVTGKILQKNAPDDLVTSVPIYGSSSAGHVLLGRVFAEGPETNFRFSTPTGTKKLLLDPYQTVLSRP